MFKHLFTRRSAWLSFRCFFTLVFIASVVLLFAEKTGWADKVMPVRPPSHAPKYSASRSSRIPGGRKNLLHRISWL